MEPKEFAELLEEIKEEYSFNDFYDDGRITVKYVDSHYDSRDGLIWSITLRDLTECNRREKNFQGKNLTKENILKFLRNGD